MAQKLLSRYYFSFDLKPSAKHISFTNSEKNINEETDSPSPLITQDKKEKSYTK